MKSFSSHILELFDRPQAWRDTKSGGNEEFYEFALAKVRGGKMVPCPLAGAAVNDFYEKQGMTITGRDGSTPLVNGKPTNLTGVKYEVGFETLSMYRSMYAPLIDNSNLRESDLTNIWELSFARMDSVLKRSSGVKPMWYFDTQGSKREDDDLGIMSGSDAVSVLATVLDIGKAFVARRKPKGILVGTKTEAKDARGRIYRGMARQNAGEVFDLPYPARKGMKHSTLIWFDKSFKFDPDAYLATSPVPLI